MNKIRIGIIATAFAFSLAMPPTQAASEPYIGEIMWVAYTFCPRGWANADGQLLPISENTALFSLLGTTYGGDGRTTFGLPDLRGRTILHVGPGFGTGLPPYTLGQRGGHEQITLTTNQMPAHSHSVNASEDRSDKKANGSILGSGQKIYDAPVVASTQLDASAIASTGANQAHENRPPYLVLRACIALTGLFPSQP